MGKAFAQGSRSLSRGRRKHRRAPGSRSDTSSLGPRKLLFEPLESRRVLTIDLQVRYEFADTDGQAVDTLHVGDEFLLRAYVQDIRDNPSGIFQAFFDVGYSASLISTTSQQITHGVTFNQGTFGSLATAGLIDDVGGVDTDQQAPIPPGAELLLFSVQFQADSAGQLSLASALPSNPGRQPLFFSPATNVALADIVFVDTSITIEEAVGPRLSVAKVQDGNEAGAVAGSFQITQSEMTGSPTVVSYTLGGAAINGTDYTQLTGTATIPAGSTSTTVIIATINDLIVEGTEDVTITLDDVLQGDPSVQIDGSANTASLNILDNDTAQVSVATTTSGNESGPTAIVFTVAQTRASSQNTVIALGYGGTATQGSDFSTPPTSVTILAGQTTAAITVPVINDTLVEANETLTVTLSNIVSAQSGITIQPGAASATAMINDNDSAQLRIAGTTPGAEAGPTAGVFTITQTAQSSTATVIVVSFAGTAAAGADYTQPSQTVTIAAGATSATITVPVINDNIVEGDETVVVRLESKTGDPQVTIDQAQREASITIADNDTAQVRITDSSDGSEDGPQNGTFTLTQTAVSDADTVLSYTLGGTATSGSDYTPLGGTVTIAAGETTATITVPVIDDDLSEGPETVILTLDAIEQGSPGITIDGAFDERSLSIEDDDPVFVTIASANNGNEEGPTAGLFIISQTGMTDVDTVLALSVAGTATSGDDYESLPATVTIAAGTTSVLLDVTVLDDNLIEGDESVMVTLAELLAGDDRVQIDSNNESVSLTITDNDTATVSVAATSNGAEDGTQRGVFTVTQSAISPLETVIVYSRGGTATAGSDYTAPGDTVTIAAGTTVAMITVPVLDDNLVEADETVAITLDSLSASHPQVSLDPAGDEASFTIEDDDEALVRIAATNNAAELDEVDGLFTITQTAPSSTPTVIAYSISGTATPGDDYTALSGTVTIAAGATSATIAVPVIDDDVLEDVESVIVTLTQITSGDQQITIDPAQDEATVLIVDDETPQVGVFGTTDADESGTDGLFTVRQTLVTDVDTVVRYTVAGTATEGADYAALTGTVTIAMGTNSATIDVALLADNLIEGDESVIIRLEEILSGDESLILDVVNQEADITIADDETGLVSIAAADGDEEGPANASFVITQDGISGEDTEISIAVAGTATEGDDYASITRSVTIPAGETSVTLTIDVNDDDLVEGDETIEIALDEITAGSPLVSIDTNNDEAAATIADNDAALVSITAGDDGDEDGPTAGQFTVSLSKASATDTVVAYSIAGSATSGDDYETLAGSVTIAAGETSAVIDVSVLDDNVVEETETVIVTLGQITGLPEITLDVANDDAEITISDNDSATISVAVDTGGSETGPGSVVFIVSMSQPNASNVEVTYTLGGTATSGDDYTAPATTVMLPAGTTSTTISIPVVDDSLLEGPETLTIELTEISGFSGDATIDENNNTASANIADNETGLVSVAATGNGSEDGPVAGQFTVTQDGITDTDTVVTFTLSGTATPGDDYASFSGTVTIAAGTTSATIDVSVIDDDIIEGDETVIVTLDSITAGDDLLQIDENAGDALVTITDNDSGLISIAAGDDVAEDGPTMTTFTVTQDGVSDVNTVIGYTVSGTATSGSDFTALSGTVTILAGETSAVIDLTALDDAIVEGTETVIVTLTEITSGASQLAIDTANDSASVSIADDDSALVSISQTTDGSESGPTAGTFTVTLSAVSSSDTVVSYTVSGSATSGSDFTALPGTVTIPAGQTTAVITVPVLNDTAVEGSEDVTVTLTDVTQGGNIDVDTSADEATLDIADNDTATIQFAAASSSTFEVDGSHSIVVRLSIPGGGTLQRAVTVNISVAGGTATGADFTLGTTSVTFAAGSQNGAERTVNITLTDDGVLEDDETLELELAIGSDGTGGQVSLGSPDSHTVTIVDDPVTGEISGYTWVDGNGNGSRDEGELPIMDVVIRLVGVDNQGQNVQRETVTDATGSYSFTELAAGTYEIIQEHPPAFYDGPESLGMVGTTASGVAANDHFTQVELGPGAKATEYNFSERGVQAQYVSLRFFLASSFNGTRVLRNTIDPATILTTQSAAAAAPQAAALAATAAPEAGAANLLASSLAEPLAETDDSALAAALAQPLVEDAAPVASALNAANTTDDASQASEPTGADGLLLEDPGNDRGIAGGPVAGDEADAEGGEQAVDQAFDENDNWLDAVV